MSLPSVSVIITTRNEARHIGDLLLSLRGQDHIHDVVLVDADSEDGTADVAVEAAHGLPLTVVVEPCSRGAGRNLGARKATGDLLAFIDGDCIAVPGWVKQMVDAWGGKDDRVVAGRTEYVRPFQPRRVPITVDGQDISWPSCNLAYPRSLFDGLGGFDEGFLTAEDMDLNLRAIQSGATIAYASNAIVKARSRENRKAYWSQAYEYGIGRAQLEAKHGSLVRTSKWKALWSQPTPTGIMRLCMGYRGYRKGRRSAP